MPMTDAQRKQQIGAICATYQRMVSNGVLPMLAHNIDDSRKIWATQVLCRLVSTFKALADCELNVLRDTLNGKPSKVHARLRDVLTQTKENPDRWVHWMMNHAPKFKRYRELDKVYTVETIPWIEAYRLLMQEERRAGRAGYRKPEWKPLQQQRRADPPAKRVSPEQQMMWGEG